VKLAKYKPQNELVLLAYKGSTFQGGFGHDKHPFDSVEDLFNPYHFVGAKGTLGQIIVRGKKQRENYERLIESYDLRVRFKQKDAYENIELVKDTRISLNKGFLGRVNTEKIWT
jgi:hypothetical protein